MRKVEETGSDPENDRTERITTDDLASRIGNPSIRIIDIRSADAYNGWKEQNEVRGGHIWSARSFPAKWVSYPDWIEIARSKDILPEHSLILYGYDRDQTEKVAALFRGGGYKDVKLYDSFVDEWSLNEKYPMDRMARYTQLVSAKWLKELIENGSAPDYHNSKFVLCHAHYRDTGDYEKGHIPRSIDLDTNTMESGKTWNRRSPPELKETLEKLGITHDTTVILYGRQSSPDPNADFPGSNAGQLAAMRCAFIMMYAGVEDVRIMNGGVKSWVDEGFELTTEDYRPEPVQEFGTEIPAHPELVVDLQRAQEMLKNRDENLVSVRSWKEYIGEVSGYNYIKKKGRIPGSVFANNGSSAYHMENYRNPDHTTREYHEIISGWESKGITSDKFNAYYCGTGWRGSEAFFNAWLIGWSRIAVFDGGWFEWSNADLPFETGIPE